jgi:hypothetical protein
MTIAKIVSVLKKLNSLWWFSPVAVWIVSFAIPLMVPRIQMTKVVESLLYPESGWVGGVSFRLNDVPGYIGKSDLDLILLTHHFNDNSHVTFLRNGSAPESVAAGAPTASLLVDRAKARTSGFPLFDVDLPPETLVAASVFAPRGGPQSRYSMITSQCIKDISPSGDLIVSTRNELRSTRIFYNLCLFALGLAAVFMPRFAHLLHPDDPDSVRSAAGAAGSD